MIPIFPNFKSVDFSDKSDVESYTHKFKPYSDFNFISLWAWDTNDERKISLLNNNLVVLFTDYQTNKPFLSFLGKHKPKHTIDQLLEYAKSHHIPQVLSLVTEESVQTLDKSNVQITEDRENFDYVFSTVELAELQGNKFSTKRHLANKFLHNHPDARFEISRLNDKSVQKQLLSTIRTWEHNKKLGSKDYDFKHEEIAIKRLLHASNSLDSKLMLSCIFLHDEILGFSIDELLPNKYSISHFAKANIAYKGIYEFLNQRVSQYLRYIKIEYWNWEQDLGVPSLQNVKSSYRPVSFLKKFKISPHS